MTCCFIWACHVKSNLNVDQEFWTWLVLYMLLIPTSDSDQSVITVQFTFFTLQNSGAKNDLLRERRVKKKKKERELLFSFLYSISILLYLIY